MRKFCGHLDNIKLPIEGKFILVLVSLVALSRARTLYRNNFPSKEQMFFNFIAAGTIWSDFGAQEMQGLGSIPGQGTRSHILQLKSSCPTTKTQHSQIKKWKQFF